MNSIWGNRKGEGGLHRHISTENPPPFLKKFTSSASWRWFWNLGEVSAEFFRGSPVESSTIFGGNRWGIVTG